MVVQRRTGVRRHLTSAASTAVAWARDARPAGQAAPAPGATRPTEDDRRTDPLEMRRPLKPASPGEAPTAPGTARRAEAGMLAGLTPERLRALDDLRWHWDEAYQISWDGRFRADRLDGQGCLRASTAHGLRELIFADYAACPVPRRYRKDPEDEDTE